jgi:type II secretory pathway pseudopilin PulG
MNCAKSSNNRAATSGFTLAEVLAALLFMAIVIPVAVQGLLIAAKAGEVAQRKGEAARVAERILNENIVTTNWNQSSQSGTIDEGIHEFKWVLRNEIWSQGETNVMNASSSATGEIAGAQPPVDQSAASQITMSLLTVEVTYAVQNQDYSVRLSTLVAPQ